MKVMPIIVVVSLTSAGLGGHLALWARPQHVDPPQHKNPTSWSGTVSANGVVEGARPEVALRPEVAGTIGVLHVRENQDVTQGALLVELQNATQKSQVAVAQ